MRKAKTALITGITGQDGAYLAAHLLRQGWAVFGGFRRGSSSTTWRLDQLGITRELQLIECQITELQNIIQVVQEIQPDLIFHLAGESFVADSFKYPIVTLDVNTNGVINLLEAVRLVSPKSKVFFASSSEVFGSGSVNGINEDSVYLPRNPYAISKVAALNFVRLYRDRYGLFVCSGFLFNHESSLRSRSFVTRKITFNLARLRAKGGRPIELGSLDAERDWGSAQDYVQGMHLMLQLNEPTDLILATGKLTSVREFLKIAASSAGFDPVFEGKGVSELCVDKPSGSVLSKVSEKYFRHGDTPSLLGDSSRIQGLTGWRAQQTIVNLIDDMVSSDMSRWRLGNTNV